MHRHPNLLNRVRSGSEAVFFEYGSLNTCWPPSADHYLTVTDLERSCPLEAYD